MEQAAKGFRLVTNVRAARLALALAGGAIVTGAVPAQAQQTGDLDQLRQQALELVNEARGEHDLPPLELGDILNEAAQAHAEDMLARDYYGHVSPEGESVMDRYQEAGGSRWRVVRENIARCEGCPTPPTIERVERFQEGWMESPEHRANILSRGLDRFGFGIAAGDDEIYAVQTFAGPGRPRGLEAGEEPEPLSADEQVSLALRIINRERQAQGAAPLSESAALTSTAETLLSQMDRQSLSLPEDGLMEALPESERRNWAEIATIAGGCGGCGTQATAADVRFFANQWLENPQYRSRLLDPGFTHLGFAMQANGEGRKNALAVLGGQR